MRPNLHPGRCPLEILAHSFLPNRRAAEAFEVKEAAVRHEFPEMAREEGLIARTNGVTRGSPFSSIGGELAFSGSRRR